jgi:Lanthionine-containing peptide SapB precursor RamS
MAVLDLQGMETPKETAPRRSGASKACHGGHRSTLSLLFC